MPLFGAPGVRWFSLQIGERAADLAQPGRKPSQRPTASGLRRHSVTEFGKRANKRKRIATEGFEQTCESGPEIAGFYVLMFKWLPGHMSRPHWHPHDRMITVFRGTWWVGTGDKFDPDSTVPLPVGSYVTHFGKEIHWDGAWMKRSGC
jgi:hypothetical protein